MVVLLLLARRVSDLLWHCPNSLMLSIEDQICTTEEWHAPDIAVFKLEALEGSEAVSDTVFSYSSLLGVSV